MILQGIVRECRENTGPKQGGALERAKEEPEGSKRVRLETTALWLRAQSEGPKKPRGYWGTKGGNLEVLQTP